MPRRSRGTFWSSLHLRILSLALILACIATFSFLLILHHAHPDEETNPGRSVGKGGEPFFVDRRMPFDEDPENTQIALRRIIFRQLEMVNPDSGAESQGVVQRGHLEYSESEHDNRAVPSVLTPRSEAIPCDQECESFRDFWNSWPKDKPRAAFYYLTRTSRLNYFRKSIASVEKYFNGEFRYPIIVFHEEEFTPQRSNVRQMTSAPVFFQKVEFRLPDFLDKPVLENIPCLSRISYRHMCRFHSKGVYQHPMIQMLDYHWRLDDDSVLLSPVNYDVFEFMQSRGLQYGYIWIHLDAYSCTEGLWEATEDFIRIFNVTPTFYNEWFRPRLFYNNFEISKVSLWLSPSYTAYVDYLDRLGGIYYHRWGDAPIKGLAVSMFLPKTQTHFFKDVGYRHGSFVNNASVPSAPSQYLNKPDHMRF